MAGAMPRHPDQRHHGLSPEARQAAAEPFERLLQSGVELRSLDRGRFRQAAVLLQDPALGLRACDALHLAVALQAAALGLAPARA